MWPIFRKDKDAFIGEFEEFSYVTLKELKNPTFIVELNGVRRFERLESEVA